MENENVVIEKKYHLALSDLVFDHETSSISPSSSVATVTTGSRSRSSSITNEPTTPSSATGDVPIFISTVHHRDRSRRYFLEPLRKERSVTRYLIYDYYLFFYGFLFFFLEV